MFRRIRRWYRFRRARRAVRLLILEANARNCNDATKLFLEQLRAKIEERPPMSDDGVIRTPAVPPLADDRWLYPPEDPRSS